MNGIKLYQLIYEKMEEYNIVHDHFHILYHLLYNVSYQRNIVLNTYTKNDRLPETRYITFSWDQRQSMFLRTLT